MMEWLVILGGSGLAFALFMGAYVLKAKRSERGQGSCDQHGNTGRCACSGGAVRILPAP